MLNWGKWDDNPLSPHRFQSPLTRSCVEQYPSLHVCLSGFKGAFARFVGIRVFLGGGCSWFSWKKRVFCLSYRKRGSCWLMKSGMQLVTPSSTVFRGFSFFVCICMQRTALNTSAFSTPSSQSTLLQFQFTPQKTMNVTNAHANKTFSCKITQFLTSSSCYALKIKYRGVLWDISTHITKSIT